VFKPDEIRMFRLLQSLKSLPSLRPGIMLAEALYLDALAAFSRKSRIEAGAFFNALVLKSFGALQIGELSTEELSALRIPDRRKLAAALYRGIPAFVTKRMKAGKTDDVLPVFCLGGAPEWANVLCERRRAGFESPMGRYVGAHPESQGAHALVTSLIAWQRGGPECALLALIHNAHVSLFPDVPHAVEKQLGSVALANMERQASKQFVRRFAKHLPDKVRTAIEGQYCIPARRRRIVDDADFVDRVLWLDHNSPNWLDRIKVAQLARIVCNGGSRFAKQSMMLNTILRERLGVKHHA
jgi:hypothetical protein